MPSKRGRPARSAGKGRTNESRDSPEWTAETFARALRGEQRRRIIDGELQPGDVAALRRFIQLTPDQFAEACGISVRTLRTWEEDRVIPRGAARALLRIAARHPRVIRALILQNPRSG